MMVYQKLSTGSENITLNKIEFESNNPPDDFENADGIITKFSSVRASNIDQANLIAQSAMETGFKIWIDDIHLKN